MSQGVDLAPAVAAALDASGVDVAALGLAWARVAPSVALVPALGLRALPGPARAVLGLLLAAVVAPSIAPVRHEGPWLVPLLGEVARGVPLALAAAVPLWVATMAGGVGDAARGAGEGASIAGVDGRTGPLGGLFGLLAAAGFVGSGGPARVASAAVELSSSPLAATAALRVVGALSSGVSLAVALAAPLLLAAFVVDVALGLAARVAAPVQLQATIAPLRALALLVATAFVLDRIAVTALALSTAGP